MNSKDNRSHYLQQLPSVDELLLYPPIKNLLESYPRIVVVNSIRKYLQEIREYTEERLAKFDFSLDNLSSNISKLVHQRLTPSLCKVINATGVIIHTNLGRSLLCSQAKNIINEMTDNYCNLEFDLKTGKRGKRNSHIESLVCELTTGEAALIVNNNAAAVFLILDTFAFKKEVIISRGQLVEIGGSFRIPDVMKKSGAIMTEVGTTNKTHLSDYEKAVTPKTAILLRVHTSNYKVIGFSKQVSLDDLVTLGKKHDILVVDDLGSGVLIDLQKYGLKSHEPTVQESIKAGVDLVSFSGDKLLGGPQAGIIVGKKKHIDKIKKNPLVRALRVDKLCLAALEATLKLYYDKELALKKIPTLNMLLSHIREVEIRAHNLCKGLKEIVGDKGEVLVEDDISQVGGGALPGEEIPTKVVSIKLNNLSIDKSAQQLRLNNPPILARISKDKLLLDARTIREEEIEIIKEAFKRIQQSKLP
ncbi:MAG: L-seryl-tRNA(Sec) selenium transferase [bacterium]|nr:L-seryl-tRNA(Sec) selenium transferase [bacterium]